MNTYNKLLAKYKNGNYYIKIYEDGTKIRFTLDNEFEPIFPESIDIKITNYCDNNCPMCHENSSTTGNHANLNARFLDTLVSGTELAIGGGNPLSHPQLLDFLNRMKNQGVICNITINQKHFIIYKDYIQKLIDEKLIYGLGISLLDDSNLKDILSFINNNPNTVIHTIAGITNKELLEKLYDNNIKLLILGYKKFGRGITYYSEEVKENINYYKENILEIGKHFYVVSFDNLAIEQLDLKNKIKKETFEKYYMGDDGNFTMYIDLINCEFASSSISTNRYKLLDDIKSMFNTIKA
jgi:organic radical activating enzyme